MSSKPRLEVLIGKHSKKNTDLYYIKHNGEYSLENYIAIGSGKDVANDICRSLNFNKISMKEFAKHAYLAIMYMDQYCPGLGVGVAPNDSLLVRYLNYNEEWDQHANPEDIRVQAIHR
jgi:20S proteasome alpha/beta subunit